MERMGSFRLFRFLVRAAARDVEDEELQVHVVFVVGESVEKMLQLVRGARPRRPCGGEDQLP
jgi:hypothetical protein